MNYDDMIEFDNMMDKNELLENLERNDRWERKQELTALSTQVFSLLENQDELNTFITMLQDLSNQKEWEFII